MGIELEDEPARPRFALAPFTLEQLAEIHRRHHAGEGIRELANEFGVDVSLLRRRLANHGFSGMSREAAQSRRSAGCARALTVMSKPLVERAAALNAAGFNSKQIAATLNLPHADIIYRSMRRHGIEPKTYVGPRHAFGWQRKLSDEQVKAAYLRFAAGERVKDIAASLGVSHCTIYWRFNDLGLPRFRERRKDWAGTPSLQKRRRRNA
jgi:IS30 family transposase